MQDAFDELEWESVFRNNDIDELWHQWCKKFFEDVSKFIPKAVPLSRKKDKATACFFFVSRYTRSLIFPNSWKKKHTRKKTQNATFCTAVRLRHRAQFVTHWGVFFFPLPMFACRNCSRAGPLPC